MNVISAWIKLRRAGVPVTFGGVCGMWLIKSLRKDVVEAMITNEREQLGLERQMLQIHALAGGRVGDVVEVMVAVKRLGLDVPVQAVCATDLSRLPVVQTFADYLSAHETDPELTFQDYVRPLMEQAAETTS